MKLFEKPEMAQQVAKRFFLNANNRDIGWAHEWAASTNEAAVRELTDSIRRAVEGCVLGTR